jgi:hypothetical protein
LNKKIRKIRGKQKIRMKKRKEESEEGKEEMEEKISRNGKEK